MNVNFVASWRPDTKDLYKNADPQKVAEEIYALGEHVETKDILEMARDKTKEIHKIIEWNDKKAADKYRLWQIRNIQSNLHIVEISVDSDKKPEKVGVPLRISYSLRGETGYRPTPYIIEDKNLYNRLLLTAKSELDSFMNKYSILTELEPVFEAIRNLNISKKENNNESVA